MKKSNLLLLVTILLLSNLSSYGQDDDKKRGVRAGWQVSNFYSDSISDNGNLNSFYVGFFTEHKIIPLLKFGSGLEYQSTGMVANDLDDTKYIRHTISIPLYLKLKLGPVFALGGAAANFGVYNKFTFLGENIDLEDAQKTKVFNVPLFLGLGVKISIISIEARYNWGLLNLSKSEGENLTNQYFQVGAAVSF